jgi:hypothetical protein
MEFDQGRSSLKQVGPEWIRSTTKLNENLNRADHPASSHHFDKKRHIRGSFWLLGPLKYDRASFIGGSPSGVVPLALMQMQSQYGEV